MSQPLSHMEPLGSTEPAQGGRVLHKQDGCCTGRMGAAHAGWVLHREDGRCTGKMRAAQGGWVLYKEDGCCTERMGAAQRGWVLHSSRSRERRRTLLFEQSSPQKHLQSLRKARIALQYRHTCSSNHRPESNGQSAKRQAATIR